MRSVRQIECKQPVSYNKTCLEKSFVSRLVAANFLITAPMLIEMSLWIYIRHRPFRRA